MGGMFGKGSSNAAGPPKYTGLNVQTSAYGLPWPLIYGTSRVGNNMMWADGFSATPVSSSSSGGGKGGGGSGGKGGKGGSGSGSYNYSADIMLGLGEGPINAVINMWWSQAIGTPTSDGVTIFNGAYGQPVWSFLESDYPGQALAYSGFAYAGLAPANLGSSPSLPNLNFEVAGLGSLVTEVETDTVPSGAPYTIQVSRAVITENSQTNAGASSINTTVYYVADIGVSYTGGAALTRVSGTPSAGQYSVDQAGYPDLATGTYTFNSADAGKSATITYTYYGDADPSFVVTDLLTNANYGLGFPAACLGTLNQNNEAHAIPSSGPYSVAVTNAAAFQFNLDVVDSSGNIYQCLGVGSTLAANQYTVNYATGVYSFAAANAVTAVTIRYASLGPLSALQNFALASGLRISPAYVSQTQVNSMMDDIATACYFGFVWSSGVLTCVPRGTVAVSGHGYSYTPNTTPLFTFTDNDFQPNTNPTGTVSAAANDDPVILTARRPSDMLNDIKIEALDRSNQYAPSIAEVTDMALIDTYGRRASATKALHMFCDMNAANVSAQLQMQDQYIVNAYSFQLDERYCVLDPMDLVTLTDPELFPDLPNNQQIVRILEITENDDGTLSVVAEQYPVSTGAAAKYSVNQSTGTSFSLNADPGPVNAPILFAPPLTMTGGDLEVWCALSGANPSAWGGCNVWGSADGVTYTQLGQQVGPARMGITTADFPAGSDPDTVDTLAVDLAMSAGSLLSASQRAADADQSLCYVGGASGAEYVSYTVATLTAPNSYDLTTYLRRGQYQTPIVDHPSGSPFARCGANDLIFKISYNADQIGQTMWLKFPSFNILDGGLESLSTVTAYEIVLPAPPAPGTVTGFTAVQTGDVVLLTWSPLATTEITGYDVAYGPVGGSIADAFSSSMITEASRATAETTVAIPVGTWNVYIRGHGLLSGQTGPVSQVTLTVTTANAPILSASYGPDWLGMLSGFVLHYTGVLMPGQTSLASALTFSELFETFCYAPVSTASFKSVPTDTGFNDSLHVYINSTQSVGPGVSGSPSVSYGLDTWLTGGSDSGTFAAWTLGNVNARYIRGEIVETPGSSPSIVSQLSLTASVPSAVTDTVQGFSISNSAGTTMVFATVGAGPFHSPPTVIPAPADGVLQSAGASAISTTQCTLQGFVSGAPSTGTVNVAITGE